MQYCTVAQVAARNAARGTYTGTSIPNASQVFEYILESGAQLDQWLYAGGFDAPFDQSIASSTPSLMLVSTAGQLLLQRWNTTGAALYVEEGAQIPMNLKLFQDMWTEIKQVILDRTIDVPLPILPSKDLPRGPGEPGSLAQPAPRIFDFSVSPKIHRQGRWDL